MRLNWSQQRRRCAAPSPDQLSLHWSELLTVDAASTSRGLELTAVLWLESVPPQALASKWPTDQELLNRSHVPAAVYLSSTYLSITSWREEAVAVRAVSRCLQLQLGPACPHTQVSLPVVASERVPQDTDWRSYHPCSFEFLFLPGWRWWWRWRWFSGRAHLSSWRFPIASLQQGFAVVSLLYAVGHAQPFFFGGGGGGS